MDWTMVANANDATHRVQTILYLFTQRYGREARSAGMLLRQEPAANHLCTEVIGEIREALSDEASSVSLGPLTSDKAGRRYLTDLLAAYDDDS